MIFIATAIAAKKKLSFYARCCVTYHFSKRIKFQTTVQCLLGHLLFARELWVWENANKIGAGLEKSKHNSKAGKKWRIGRKKAKYLRENLLLESTQQQHQH